MIRLKTLGAFAWVCIAVFYVWAWYQLDQLGAIQAFADHVIQPWIPENREAYTGVNAVILIVLIGLGGRSCRK
jgi:hypothetical protein